MGRIDQADFSRFKHLLDDALDIVDVSTTPEENRTALLSALKLDKLLLAEKRASESLSLLIDLSVTPEAISSALSTSAREIDTIDKLMVYNNESYFRIMEAVSRELNK